MKDSEKNLILDVIRRLILSEETYFNIDFGPDKGMYIDGLINLDNREREVIKKWLNLKEADLYETIEKGYLIQKEGFTYKKTVYYKGLRFEVYDDDCSMSDILVYIDDLGVIKEWSCGFYSIYQLECEDIGDYLLKRGLTPDKQKEFDKEKKFLYNFKNKENKKENKNG